MPSQGAARKSKGLDSTIAGENGITHNNRSKTCHFDSKVSLSQHRGDAGLIPRQWLGTTASKWSSQPQSRGVQLLF